MAVVDRCVCRGVTFADLKDLVDRTGADLDAIADQTGCGCACSTCVPYLKRMIETGETCFEAMPAPSGKRWFQKG